jgi:hypothetical protein
MPIDKSHHMSRMNLSLTVCVWHVCFCWFQHIASPNRWFVHEGDLYVWLPGKDHYSSYFVFLFSNLVLITKKRSSKKCLVHTTILLDDTENLMLQDLDQNEGHASFEFGLCGESLQFYFSCQSESEKKDWIDSFKDVLEGTEHYKEPEF